jgi:hypothetical protein
LGQKDRDVSFAQEVLDATQAGVLKAVGPVLQSKGFYLAGGTALALQLGHRRSADLDWFVEGPFGDSNILAAGLCAAGIDFKTEIVGRGTLHGSVSGVRVSLLEFPYPMLQQKVHFPDAACEMASLDDIAAMKLSATAQRGTRKDFVDVYALIARHATLAQLLGCYQRKFSIKEPGHILYALSYFDDAEKGPMPQMLWRVGWQTVKAHLRKSVADFADQ